MVITHSNSTSVNAAFRRMWTSTVPPLFPHVTSQVVESYLTKLVQGATKKFAGKMVGGLLSQATESAIAFATTYAIGHAANRYYASGKSISMDQVKEVFGQMLNQGRTLTSQYTPQILQQSSRIKTGDLLSLVRN